MLFLRWTGYLEVFASEGAKAAKRTKFAELFKFLLTVLFFECILVRALRERDDLDYCAAASAVSSKRRRKAAG